MMANLTTAQPHIRAGRLRGLGVGTKARSPLFPEMPTISESGVPGYEASGWFGMLAPVHISKEILTKLNVEFNRALTLPDVKERLSALAMEAGGGSPDDFARFIKADTEKWARIIKEAGITMQ